MPYFSGGGLSQGFHWFDEVQGAVERPASEVANRAISWLAEQKTKDCFLWVHFYDPHWPYNPPDPYNQMYEPRQENQFDKFGDLAGGKRGRNEDGNCRQQSPRR